MVPMSKIFVRNCTVKAAEDEKIVQNKILVAGSNFLLNLRKALF